MGEGSSWDQAVALENGQCLGRAASMSSEEQH